MQPEQMPRGRIAKITQRLMQHDQQQMEPLIGVGLGHAEQGCMGNLKRGHFQIAQQEQQTVFGRRQWRVGIGRIGWFALSRSLA